MDMNDILTRLQNGESADEIAKSFADMLNGAIQKQKEEEEAASKRYVDKVAALTHIVNCVGDFIEEFYPEIMTKEVETLRLFTTEDIENFIKAFDEAVPRFKRLNAAMVELEDFLKPPSLTGNQLGLSINEDKIAKFLKDNGLV